MNMDTSKYEYDGAQNFLYVETKTGVFFFCFSPMIYIHICNVSLPEANLYTWQGGVSYNGQPRGRKKPSITQFTLTSTAVVSYFSLSNSSFPHLRTDHDFVPYRIPTSL